MSDMRLGSECDAFRIMPVMPIDEMGACSHRAASCDRFRQFPLASPIPKLDF